MPSKNQYILGIDPGRAKCGLALVYHSQKGLEPLCLSVIKIECLEKELGKLKDLWGVDRVVLGDGTGKGEILTRLVHYFSAKIPISLIDERNSSCEARGRYWLENPPQGLWRLIPCSLRVPPEPYDQYVALILIERYLEKE